MDDRVQVVVRGAEASQHPPERVTLAGVRLSPARSQLNA